MSETLDIDAESIRETMLLLGDELSGFGDGWKKVRDDLNSSTFIAVAVRNPMTLDALKVIDKYLQALAQECKEMLMKHQSDEHLKRAWTLIDAAYKDIQQATRKGLDAPPVQIAQECLTALGFYRGPVNNQMDAPTGVALQAFRKRIGLPTDVGFNQNDLAMLMRHSGRG